MTKVLSYQEFMDLSKQYYLKGGDGYYECWDQKTFDEYVKMFGGITKIRLCKCIKCHMGFIKIEWDIKKEGYNCGAVKNFKRKQDLVQ